MRVRGFILKSFVLLRVDWIFYVEIFYDTIRTEKKVEKMNSSSVICKTNSLGSNMNGRELPE